MTRRIDLRKIRWVFISHEHSDHVYGLAGLCSHMDCRAFMTSGTYDNMRPKYRPDDNLITIFRPGDSIQAGPFVVHSFPKPHDVVEPCSFRVEVGDVNVGVFTDIGDDCQGLRQNLSACTMAFMESNYDPDLLAAGPYPQILKDRITCGRGHLSNPLSARIVTEVAPPNLKALFLSHVSEDNNRPDIALQAFASLKDKYLIKVMSRHEASDIWRITDDGLVCEPTMPIIPDRLDRPAVQLDLS